MLGKRDRSAGGNAVAIFATSFVVIGGAATCIFIGMLSGESPLRLLTITAACFGGILFLLWLLREKQPGNIAAERWSWLARGQREKVEYRLSPRVPRSERSTAPIPPPTAESVRELTGGVATWIPAKGVSRQETDSPRQPGSGD
jgi:hypothetical protein